jgi:hypothetical protein
MSTEGYYNISSIYVCLKISVIRGASFQIKKDQWRNGGILRTE